MDPFKELYGLMKIAHVNSITQDPLSLNIAAIFIGSNLAFAGVTHYKQIMDDGDPKAKLRIVVCIIASGIACIVGSRWFVGDPVFVYIGMILLVYVYGKIGKVSYDDYKKRTEMGLDSRAGFQRVANTVGAQAEAKEFATDIWPEGGTK